MGGRNQKITAYFLLVLILAPLSYMFLLQNRQQSIRQRMKTELEQSLLQDLVIPAGELVWFKPGKEIFVDNQLFDIKSIRYSQDGNAYISGLFDREETILVHQMKKDWDEQNKNSSRQVVLLFKMAQSLPGDCQLNTDSIFIEINSRNIAGAPSLLSGFNTIITPPPQA